MTTATARGRHARHGPGLLMLLAAAACASALALAVSQGSSAPATPARPAVHAAVHHPAAAGQPSLPTLHPRPAVRYVTVRAGDCLWTIAAAHHVTWQALYAANRAVIGGNPNLISTRMRLAIPARHALHSER